MAFPVAVQSAIFYVLACTPCMAARTRYRTRQKSRREREERARLDEEDPQLYRHPSPFNVNPYWEEEIRMGPSLPKKGRPAHNVKSTSQRKLTSASKDSTSTTGSSFAISTGGALHDSSTAPATADPPGLPTGRPTTATRAHAGSTNNRGSGDTAVPPASPTLVPDDTHSMNMLEPVVSNATTTEGWNHKLYQREDEELWGSELSRTHKLMDAIVKAGSSAGRLLESTLGKERAVTDEDRAKFYAPAVIHPPVNEFHPPVVSSKPARKDGLHWMLQPPPSAKVMEGKVPVSRSGSVASSIAPGRRSTAAGSEVSLTRRMAMEARLRRVESNNSGTTSRARAATPSADDGGDQASPIRTPKRAASRKTSTAGRSTNLRPKSQHRTNMQMRARSRSGSLASSPETTGWSSDDGDMDVRTKWQFPRSSDGTGAAAGAGAPTDGQGGMSPTSVVPAAGNTAQQPQSPVSTPLQAPSMHPKLATFVGSDANGTANRTQTDNTLPKTAKDCNLPPLLFGADGLTADAKKLDHARLPVDSGLALTA